MWKDFFYFSKTERASIVVMLILIAVAVGGALLYPLWVTPPEAEKEQSEEEYKAFIASVHQQERKEWKKFPRYKKQTVVLSPFDPNTADSVTLVRLGLRPYIARNILRYRAKGGKFRTPKAFAKVYGITPEQFLTLLPFINIGEQFRKTDTLRIFPKTEKDKLKYFKYAEGIVIELNGADTTELKKIPGIGSGLARLITGYRARLGGFYSTAQLQEIPHIPSTLNRWFSIKQTAIRQLDFNRASVERLSAHPYINFYQAKAIVDYRKKKGMLKSLKPLTLYEEFTPADMERIAPYACFNSN
ncbi:MAG: helix-hairpin-helix domain-containing protein [Bacteroides sp.]